MVAMCTVRCLECGTWLGRLAGKLLGLRRVRHSDDVAEVFEVLRCGNCGQVHELQREAA